MMITFDYLIEEDDEGSIDEPFMIEVTAEVVLEIEHNYGADADGRRGTTQTWYDVQEISATRDGQPFPLSDRLEDTLVEKAMDLAFEKYDTDDGGIYD